MRTQTQHTSFSLSLIIQQSVHILGFVPNSFSGTFLPRRLGRNRCVPGSESRASCDDLSTGLGATVRWVRWADAAVSESRAQARLKPGSRSPAGRDHRHQRIRRPSPTLPSKEAGVTGMRYHARRCSREWGAIYSPPFPRGMPRWDRSSTPAAPLL